MKSRIRSWEAIILTAYYVSTASSLALSKEGPSQSFAGRTHRSQVFVQSSSGLSPEYFDVNDVSDGEEARNRKSERTFSTLDDNQSLIDEGLQVKPIGVVRSIYKLCVGTPRQGLLAPKARGSIEMLTLGNSSPASSILGLEGYSHIWVIFVFHLNTQSRNASRKVKSKITPPALGGEKVGIYATRTPHRFNPIGMTLCKLDGIERMDKRNVRLLISGLDLVCGTLVLDIKPYVPVYDAVAENHAVVPNWVENGLSLKRSVEISDAARSDLEYILRDNPNALEFYGPNRGDETMEGTFESVLECVRQVLATDVRSTYQINKSRTGNSRAERSTRLGGSSSMSGQNQCTQQLDNLLISFRVEEPGLLRNPASKNSGAEDTLVVTGIELFQVKGDNDGS